MRTLRYMVLALLFLLLVVVVIGFFLPSKVHLERSTVIDRDANKIFSVINSLSNFNKWSPWYDYDLNASYTLSGAESGVGSKLTWQGNEKVGKGSNEIIDSKQDEFIKTKFYFGKSEKPAFSKISLMKVETGTKVTWAFDNDFGYNIFYRYFGLVLEDMIAPDYEKGLKKLKEHIESSQKHDYSHISIVTTESEKVYAYHTKSGLEKSSIQANIGMAYLKINKFITQNNIEMNGSPKLSNMKQEGGYMEFVASLPVASNDVIDESGEIIAESTYHGKAIKLVHVGSFDNFALSYQVLSDYMAENNLKTNGPAWEDFVTDPALVKPEELTTHIYQPIK